ncbi:MAG: DUF2461 domain-containing protein [Octadecabacter sp.]|nr:DUF2461 domain-containing protein [Octadecabacter sp.]
MFSTLIADAQTFLRSLAQNNSRDWFHANKPRYDSALRDPALALLDEMTPRLATLTGYAITPKLFRPHRDVRFSKNKTPYKTHLHMMWTPALKRVPSPYGKDHPHRDLLRHKDLVLAGSPDLSRDLPERLATAFADIWPVADMLIGVAETPTL